jgi:hypothetical protein
MRRFLSPVAFAIVSSLLASPMGAEVVIEARQWSADVAGLLRLDGSAPGEIIDLEEDLGLESDDAIEGRLVIRPTRRTVIRFGWLPMTFLGDEVVTRTINFMGTDFEVSTRVESELELEYGRVGFAWQFLSSKDRRFRLGPMVEAKGLRGTATLSAPDIPTPLRESEEFETAFASAGILVDLEPSDRFHIFAETSVLVDDSQGDLVDTEIGMRLFILEKVALLAGFRTLEIDAEDDDDLLELDFEAAFFGLSLHF